MTRKKRRLYMLGLALLGLGTATALARRRSRRVAVPRSSGHFASARKAAGGVCADTIRRARVGAASSARFIALVAE